MRRKVRINASGALHNIIIWGTERRWICSDDEDLYNFFKRQGNIVIAAIIFHFAWALIPNTHIPFRYLEVRKLGVSSTKLFKKFIASRSSVSISVKRGEKIANNEQ